MCGTCQANVAGPSVDGAAAAASALALSCHVSAAPPPQDAQPLSAVTSSYSAGGDGNGCCGSFASIEACCGELSSLAPADTATAEELVVVRRERDDALQMVQELAARAAALLVALDERCAELSHMCLQRDMLRRQLDTNRAAMVQCARLLATGRLQDCVRLALAVAGVGVYPCQPGEGAPMASTAAAPAAAGVAAELLR